MQQRLIMLIDDDVDDQHLFLDALLQVDKAMECVIANDGLEALTVLQQRLPNMPDLIFLDMNMPRMDGIKFLQEVKAVDGIKDIPIIVYSTSNQAKQKVGNLGAVDFVVKPDNFQRLCDIIELAIKKDWKA